jgi:ketosteroid isomerase-like protein
MDPKNVKVIQDAYAAFGSGNIDELLGYMAENVDWQTFGPVEIPTMGRRNGKAEVGWFFQQVADTWQFDHFEPRQFIAQGDLVVSLGFYDGKARKTSRPFSSEFAHIFTVKDGRITRFREYADTANMMESLALSFSHA